MKRAVVMLGLGAAFAAPVITGEAGSAITGEAGSPLMGEAGGAFTVHEQGRGAYSTMAEALPEEWRLEFARGRTVFGRPWLAAPAKDEDFDGLGPVFNRLSCIACHPRNGRGSAPGVAAEPMRTMLVRLSVPGQDSHGGPKPHPAYGDQLNENGIDGVPGEGRAEIHWTARSETLPGGLVVELRRPTFRFVDLAYGDLGADVLISPRIGQPIIGLGLLEAVGEADILAAADPDDSDGDGVSGRPNRVWDVGNGRVALGRFGWKANQPSLHQQLAGAMIGDLGITSPLMPHQNCTPAQAACRHAPQGGTPELTAGQLHALTTYHLGLGVPARRDAGRPEVKRGETLFAAAGCAACHLPALTTSRHAVIAELGGQTIHPFTDLLLHDMGDGLADGRPDFLANGNEWRTPPLWGFGLRGIVNEQAGLLHDGRARTPIEAILWHGGEGQRAADAVRAMSVEDRGALLLFLDSL